MFTFTAGVEVPIPTQPAESITNGDESEAASLKTTVLLVPVFVTVKPTPVDTVVEISPVELTWISIQKMRTYELFLKQLMTNSVVPRSMPLNS